MRKAIVAVSLVSMLIGVGAGCSKKDKEDELAESVANSIVLGMAKEQYKGAKAKYDRGEDASADCIIDTDELRKDKNPEAQQLAKDIDRLCEVDVPAKHAIAEIDKYLTRVIEAKTDKDKEASLGGAQIMLQGACDDAASTLKKIASKGLSSEPNAKALEAKKTEACTKDNLEGKAGDTAKKK